MHIHIILLLASITVAGSFGQAKAAPYVFAGVEVGKTFQSEIPSCSMPIRLKTTERLCWTEVPPKLVKAKLRRGELKYSNGPSWMKSASAIAMVNNSTEIVEYLRFESHVLRPAEAVDTITTTLGSPDYTQSKPTLTWAHWEASGVKVRGDNSKVGEVEIESSVYKEILKRYQ